MKRRSAGLACMGLAMCFSASHAIAGKPAALVLTLSGIVAPDIEPMSELEVGAVLKLDADAEVEFLDYALCQEIVVRGGEMQISDQGHRINGGKVIERRPAHCPKEVAVGASTQFGGIILRSAASKHFGFSSKPGFVVVGSKANTVARIDFWDDFGRKASGGLRGRVFRWPENAQPLRPDREYHVILHDVNGDTLADFTVAKDKRAQSGPARLLRID